MSYLRSFAGILIERVNVLNHNAREIKKKQKKQVSLNNLTQLFI